MTGNPQSGGASPTEPPLGLGQTVVAGLAEGLLDFGVVKVCFSSGYFRNDSFFFKVKIGIICMFLWEYTGCVPGSSGS